METPSDRVLASWREHARREFLKEEWPQQFAENVHFYNIMKTIENSTRRLARAEELAAYPIRYVLGGPQFDPETLQGFVKDEVHIY